MPDVAMVTKYVKVRGKPAKNWLGPAKGIVQDYLEAGL
jgi:hypothetical protein